MTSYQSPGKNTSSISGTTLSSWSRQQKIAMIAGFVILGFLIAMSACSKQASKPTAIGVSKPEAAPSASTPTASTTPAPVAVEKKKARKHPAAIVTYRDPNSGLSFHYPRKYELASGERAKAEANLAMPMNFVHEGGTAIASVAAPSGSYPGTDFRAAFFDVNVNRSLSEQECSQFAVVDSRNPEGSAQNPEKVEVGSMQLDKMTDFNGSGIGQTEVQYFHRYEGGACYEFVLGLDTAGFGRDAKIEAVNRDEVFAKLGKILESVKIQPVEVEQEQVATTATTTPAPAETAKQ